MDSVQDLIKPAAVELEVVLAPTLNFAFYQNSVPVIRDLAVVNQTETALEAIELGVASEPVFLAPKVWRIERIGPAQRYHVSNLDVELDGGFLSRLTEAERAEIRFTLRSAGRAPVEVVRSVELLARNQWAGIGYVPELLAAFIQPNDPAVDRILKNAAGILRSHGKDPALEGYRQGGKARAWELASALWAAVRALDLDYALPPASFERTGQKVRSPSQVCEAGLGTCLDLTLLFAACLEQLGLNPVVVFTEGHSLAGCWLKPEEFANAVIDDVTAIRKRIDLEEMILFETTVVTGAHGAGFAHAIERGVQQVSPAEEERFEIAVDIRRARMHRIRPLAAAEPAGAAAQPEAGVAGAPPNFEEAPSLTEESVVEAPDEPAETPSGRLARWQRRLLDLSLRNNLLNFRASKRVLALDAPEPARLEDSLAEGRRLKIRPRPAIMEGDDPRSAAVHQARHHEDARRQHAIEALARDEVLVGLPEEDLETRLVELYRAARLSLQEGGANTLFSRSASSGGSATPETSGATARP